MGVFMCLPVVIPYGPPVSMGAVDQGVLLVFLKRQVVVSERRVVLQSDDHPLSCTVRSHLAEINKKTSSKKHDYKYHELYEFQSNKLLFCQERNVSVILLNNRMFYSSVSSHKVAETKQLFLALHFLHKDMEQTKQNKC